MQARWSWGEKSVCQHRQAAGRIRVGSTASTADRDQRKRREIETNPIALHQGRRRHANPFKNRVPNRSSAEDAATVGVGLGAGEVRPRLQGIRGRRHQRVGVWWSWRRAEVWPIAKAWLVDVQSLAHSSCCVHYVIFIFSLKTSSLHPANVALPSALPTCWEKSRLRCLMRPHLQTPVKLTILVVRTYVGVHLQRKVNFLVFYPSASSSFQGFVLFASFSWQRKDQRCRG